jgi:hypothetical protein
LLKKLGITDDDEQKAIIDEDEESNYMILGRYTNDLVKLHRWFDQIRSEEVPYFQKIARAAIKAQAKDAAKYKHNPDRTRIWMGLKARMMRLVQQEAGYREMQTEFRKRRATELLIKESPSLEKLAMVIAGIIAVSILTGHYEGLTLGFMLPPAFVEKCWRALRECWSTSRIGLVSSIQKYFGNSKLKDIYSEVVKGDLAALHWYRDQILYWAGMAGKMPRYELLLKGLYEKAGFVWNDRPIVYIDPAIYNKPVPIPPDSVINMMLAFVQIVDQNIEMAMELIAANQEASATALREAWGKTLGYNNLDKFVIYLAGELAPDVVEDLIERLPEDGDLASIMGEPAVYGVITQMIVFLDRVHSVFQKRIKAGEMTEALQLFKNMRLDAIFRLQRRWRQDYLLARLKELSA